MYLTVNSNTYRIYPIMCGLRTKAKIVRFKKHSVRFYIEDKNANMAIYKLSVSICKEVFRKHFKIAMLRESNYLRNRINSIVNDELKQFYYINYFILNCYIALNEYFKESKTILLEEFLMKKFTFYFDEIDSYTKSFIETMGEIEDTNENIVILKYDKKNSDNYIRQLFPLLHNYYQIYKNKKAEQLSVFIENDDACFYKDDEQVLISNIEECVGKKFIIECDNKCQFYKISALVILCAYILQPQKIKITCMGCKQNISDIINSTVVDLKKHLPNTEIKIFQKKGDKN